MNRWAAAGLSSALTTLTAAFALRGADATLVVVAVAAISVLLTWFAHLHTSDAESGLPIANPASAVALAVAGRQQPTTLLPIVTAHVVGAVAAGLAALGLGRWLGGAQVGVEPHWVVAAVAAFVVSIVATWATFAIDGGGSVALAAVPPAVGGAALPVAFAGAANPAVVLGIATSGVLPWGIASVAATASLGGAVAGAYLVKLLLPYAE